MTPTPQYKGPLREALAAYVESITSPVTRAQIVYAVAREGGVRRTALRALIQEHIAAGRWRTSGSGNGIRHWPCDREVPEVDIEWKFVTVHEVPALDAPPLDLAVLLPTPRRLHEIPPHVPLVSLHHALTLVHRAVSAGTVVCTDGVYTHHANLNPPKQHTGPA